MAASKQSEQYLDDSDIGDPWDRMDRLGKALQVVADQENTEKVTPARQLLQSLEQRIKEQEESR